MKIVVLDGYAANPGDLSWERLEALGQCVVYPRTSANELLQRAAEAEILLTNKVIINKEAMEALPQLKYIGVLATGYNVVDVVAARERGIVVTNIPAYSTPSVAQMVFAHILNITQRVGHYAEEVRQGVWTACPDFSYSNTPLWELQGKKIGIVGLGNTGYNTARIAIGFGMKVYAYTSTARIPLEGVAVMITDQDNNAVAMGVTDKSGKFGPIALTVPDRSDSLTPTPPERPYILVNMHARLANYEQIESENVQVFADTVTIQNFEMIPLSELPQQWTKTEFFNTPPQNL